MTNEEARKYNINLREYMRITDKNSEYKFLKENYEALETADQALKLQHPKLVIYESDGDFDGVPVYDMARCPNCDHLYFDDDDNWEEPYCMKCGQALKWEVDAKC